MLDAHPSTHRADTQPTEAEIWSRLEAKSDDMAADLLHKVQRAAATHSRRRESCPVRITTLLACGAAAALILFLLR